MTRQLLVRLGGGQLPSALQATLRDEVVLAGWLRATGILADVTLKTISGSPRRFAGSLHAVSIQGSVGMAGGDVTCGLHAILVRETESGLETVAGEITDARIVVLEGHVEALDDLAATRSPHAAGLMFLDPVAPAAAESSPAAFAQPAAPVPVPVPAPAPVPVAVPVPVPAPEEPAKPRPSPTFMSATMPQRIQKPQAAETEHLYPDAGDLVEHFAFGECEVMKSDGDRLHVRLDKDGRIKEISLDMLKVTELEAQGGKRKFKLARRL